MSFFDSPIPDERRAGAQARVVAYFGSERDAALRALFQWLNLTLLLMLPWPAVVTFLDAPSVRPENTPFDWFLLRLAAPLVVLLITVRFWRLSGAPGEVATARPVVELISQNRLIGQIVLFLVGLALSTSALLLLNDPSRAAKTLSVGLAESLAIQVLIAGYVKSVLETLDGQPVSIFLACLALFAVTFAIRSTLAALIQPDATAGLVIGALGGGIIVGLVIGAGSLMLRDRTASLVSGVALQLLLATIIPAFIDP